MHEILDKKLTARSLEVKNFLSEGYKEVTQSEDFAYIVAINPHGVDGFIQYLEEEAEIYINWIMEKHVNEESWEIYKEEQEILNDEIFIEELKFAHDLLYINSALEAIDIKNLPQEHHQGYFDLKNQIQLHNKEFEEDSFFINSSIENLPSLSSTYKRILEIKEESENRSPEVEEALQCIGAGLFHAAKATIELSVYNSYKGKWFLPLISKAKEIETKKANAKKAGEKGAMSRWEPKEKTKSYAIELYLNGNFKNPSQAA